MASRGAPWTLLGDVSVRNVPLYENIDLPLDGASFFAASMYGGPIAIGQAIPGSNGTKIFIMPSNSTDGNYYASIEASNIHSIHWTKCQKLIVVQKNGKILLYTALGVLLSTTTIDQETQELGIAKAKTFSNVNTTGLAILNNAHHIFAVNSVNEPVPWRIKPYSQRGRSDTPTCWTIISRPHNPTHALICVKSQFFYGVQCSMAQPYTFEWAISGGEYVASEPNYDHSFIALLNSTGYIQVVSSDLQSETYRVNFSSTLWNNSILWCGNYVLTLRDSPNSLYMISMNSTSYRFSYKSNIFTDTEPDGIKVFTRESAQLLTIVPEDIVNVLAIMSKDPGSYLLEASMKLLERDHNFYDCIKAIGDQMSKAIDQCLMCAAHQFDISIQKSSLRAANIGRAHYTRYNSSKYIEVLRTLRVLNEIRRLGVPISYAQLSELSIPALIDRLIDLKHWPMAIKICDYLEIPLDEGVYRVLGHWASHLMESYLNDVKTSKQAQSAAEIAEKLFKKLDEYPGISYADTAEAAAKKNLSELAGLLLDREPNIERQVSMLLKLNHIDAALKKATQSQQPNLLQIVISHLREHRSKAEVDILLSKIPQALRLYQGYIREEAPERALALYKQQDDFIRQALYYLDVAKETSSVFEANKKIICLREVEKCFNNIKEPAIAQLVSSSIQILKENIKKDEEHHTNLADSSLRETFIWNVGKGDLSIAENLKKHYKLGDKQYWYWTIEAFAREGKWHHLEQFGRAKKSPIGYLPFIQACVKYGNRDMAAKFMDKIIIYEEQVKANLIRGNVMAAATLAAEKKDVETLRRISSKSRGQQEIRDKISVMIQSI